jgi:endonuclease/exonuclease/phosphatase family metal-dependent hydrolase
LIQVENKSGAMTFAALLRKILHSLILTVTFGVVVLLLICGFAHVVRPTHSAFISFWAYGFPLLALANLFFLVYWTARVKWWALVPLAGFILTYGSARSWFPVNLKQEEATGEVLKVLSYNVEFLDCLHDTTSNGLNPIVEYIRDSGADIVCMEEVGPDFVLKGRFEPKTKKALKEYRYLISGEQESRFSVVLLSKHRVLRFGRIQYKSMSNSSFYYDILYRGDTIRVINNHLESNKLNPNEKNRYSDLIVKRESNQLPEVAEELGSKVGHATTIRSSQADSVSKCVHQSPYPVIVCGDFNDVPGSYTYRTIRKGLLDSWLEKGNGWGNTFHEHYFLFRIDYILHSPSFRCVKTKVDKVDYSDHYPIWSNLQKL